GHPLTRVLDVARTDRGGTRVRRPGGRDERAVAGGDVHERRGAGISGGEALVLADLHLDHGARTVVGDVAAGLREGRGAACDTGEQEVAVAVRAVGDRDEGLQILL